MIPQFGSQEWLTRSAAAQRRHAHHVELVVDLERVRAPRFVEGVELGVVDDAAAETGDRRTGLDRGRVQDPETFGTGRRDGCVRIEAQRRRTAPHSRPPSRLVARRRRSEANRANPIGTLHGVPEVSLFEIVGGRPYFDALDPRSASRCGCVARNAKYQPVTVQTDPLPSGSAPWSATPDRRSVTATMSSGRARLFTTKPARCMSRASPPNAPTRPIRPARWWVVAQGQAPQPRGICRHRLDRAGTKAALSRRVAARRLIYACRVGTGIDNAELGRLWRRLQPLATDTMPLDVPPPTSRFGSLWMLFVQPSTSILVTFVRPSRHDAKPCDGAHIPPVKYVVG